MVEGGAMAILAVLCMLLVVAVRKLFTRMDETQEARVNDLREFAGALTNSTKAIEASTQLYVKLAADIAVIKTSLDFWKGNR